MFDVIHLHKNDVVIQNYLSAGVPSQKILLGLVFHGRYWNDLQSINIHKNYIKQK